MSSPLPALARAWSLDGQTPGAASTRAFGAQAIHSGIMPGPGSAVDPDFFPGEPAQAVGRA